MPYNNRDEWYEGERDGRRDRLTMDRLWKEAQQYADMTRETAYAIWNEFATKNGVRRVAVGASSRPARPNYATERSRAFEPTTK